MPELNAEAHAIVRRIAGEPLETTLLSVSLNEVYRVRTADREVVVKILKDLSVDARAEQRLAERLQSPFVRPVMHIEELPTSGDLVVIMPFIEGVSLDQMLTRADNLAEHATWALQMDALFRSIAEVPVTGFGRFAADAPAQFQTWSQFLDWYQHRQEEKAPRIASMRFRHIWNCFDRRRNLFDEAAPEPILVPADVNARNFLISDYGRRLHIIHMPILWHGDKALPYGEALLHLDGTRMGDELAARACFPAWRLDWYGAFTAYTILAFIERFDSTPLEQARAWGGSRTLLELLDERLARLDA